MRIKGLGLKLAGRFVNLIGDRFFTSTPSGRTRQPYMPIEPDTATGLNSSAARFSASPPQADHRLNSEIDDIFLTHKFLSYQNGTPCDDEACSFDTLRSLANGDLHLGVLEHLHRLLCEDKDPEQVVAVDNGAGRLAHLAVALSTMGTRVIVKDPDGQAIHVHRKLSHAHGKDDLITHADATTEIMEHTPADVVYWENPSSGMDLRNGTHMTNVANSYRPGNTSHLDYLGRDVKPGGFLVIQTDIDDIALTAHDPAKWITVHCGRITGKIIPTNFNGLQWLVIYERKE